MVAASNSPQTRTPLKQAALFVGTFLVLYAAAVWIVERNLRQIEPETALQKLSAHDGTPVDWLVLGASHALPLDFGDVPDRLQSESGQTMLILAEVGAGPVYSAFVLDRALDELTARRVLFVADSFAFASENWNEARFSDRKLLAHMPLEVATARRLASRVTEGKVPVTALADYLTGFSKLNPVDRFPTQGWQGQADFDKTHRTSRHAVSARIAYLYPDGAPDPEIIDTYLAELGGMIDAARRSGAEFLILKPPVPPEFSRALTGEAMFDAALAELAEVRSVPFLDHSAEVADPTLYFDTDHLNRQGVDTYYQDTLRDVFQSDAVRSER
ncbi:MAG: hypothetical protein NXH97_13715 [Rhodobacteraceae bacterium]|nr:hypothetical protein [Paracoccaceae bacterium]